MTTAPPLSETELNTLRGLLDNGCSISEIARVMRRSRPTISHHAKSDKRDPSVLRIRYTPAEDAVIARMIAGKETFKKIGQALGRSPDNIWGRAYRLGLVVTDRAPPPEKAADLFAKAMNGKRFEDHPAVKSWTPIYMPARKDGYRSEYSSTLGDI